MIIVEASVVQGRFGQALAYYVIQLFSQVLWPFSILISPLIWVFGNFVHLYIELSTNESDVGALYPLLVLFFLIVEL